MSAPRGAVLVLTTDKRRSGLEDAARDAAIDLVTVSTVQHLLKRLGERQWSSTVLSLSVPPADEALAARIASEPSAGALLLSSRESTFELAMVRQRVGAVGLLREPFVREDLRRHFGAIAKDGPAISVGTEAGAPPSGRTALIGTTEEMAAVFEVMAQVAASTATVLITGESGTGKEVVARTLHEASDRSNEPFVAVNCAAIPEHLLESELFGHERGAFTGAVSQRIGRFERANRGTLFLDEIGDMSIVLQAKVLRALEERTVEPVGGEQERPVDVRILAATNRDLRRLIDEGRFREDLVFRLAVVELQIPPLRERRADIRPLALHFVQEFAARHGRRVTGITHQALLLLETLDWRGNVRELRNVLDRAVLLANDATIRAADLRTGPETLRASALSSLNAGEGFSPTMTLREVEEAHIRLVLEHVNGHVGQAAKLLGIHRNTLGRRLQDYGLGRWRRDGGPEGMDQ